MVLVSVFGDFHSSILPVYVEMSTKITKHICIYDDYKHDIKEAKNLIKGMKKYNKKYNLDIKIITLCIDEDSKNDLELIKEFIRKKCKKNEVYINATDGLSSINSYLSAHLIPLGYKFISYDRYDNEVNILANDAMNRYRLEVSIPIVDHFLLKNIVIDTLGKKDYAQKYQNQLKLIFEKHQVEFKKFVQYVLNPQNRKKNDINLEQQKFKNINKILKQMGINKQNLISNQNLITGGFFEYYVYNLVKEYNCDDIEIGLTAKKHLNDTFYIPNEFDILIMKNNHLHIIECKYSNNISQEQLVYKYLGLKQLVDDDGKICLVTMHDNPTELYEEIAPLKYLPHKRAKANQMLLLGNPFADINAFKQNLANFFDIA